MNREQWRIATEAALRTEIARLREENAELQKQKDYWQALAISRALEPKP